MIIGIVSQKGGVGKSTLTQTLAREAVAGGMSVLVADLDIQQGSTMAWHRLRLENEITPTLDVRFFSTAAQAISAGQDFDILIIDGPARASKGTLEIAEAADFVIQPTGASLQDLAPAVLVFNDLTVNRNVPISRLAFALNRIGTQAEERATRDYLKQTGYQVLNGGIYERPAYRQAQNRGYSFTETRYSRLNDRADAMIQDIVNRIAKQNKPRANKSRVKQKELV